MYLKFSTFSKTAPSRFDPLKFAAAAEMFSSSHVSGLNNEMSDIKATLFLVLLYQKSRHFNGYTFMEEKI